MPSTSPTHIPVRAAALSLMAAMAVATATHAATGLTESVYHNILPYTAPGVGYTPTDTSFDTEQAYIASVTPDYSFTNLATTFQYNGGDGSPTNTVLGLDAAGAALTDMRNFYDTAVQAVGTIAVSTPGAYTFTLASADDGARVYVGGSLIAEQNFSQSGLNTPSSATINLSGPESFKLFFYQTVNGAQLNYSVTGPGGVSYSTAMSAVPEPATWALMLIGVAGLGGGLRRRRCFVAGI